MAADIITLVGGTGFLGKYVARALAKAGYRLKIVCRHPEMALGLKTVGDLGQCVLVKGDLSKPDSVIRHLEGSYAVVNLVGVLFEKGRQNFTALHAQGAEKLAQATRYYCIPRFIQISALGADHATASKYARTKLLGEKAVTSAFPEATILRPSVIFGPEDQFYNRFAAMAEVSPFLPLIGGGNNRFQPVYAGDVAQAVLEAARNPHACGNVYELGGPGIYTFRELLEFILRATGRKRKLVNIPFGLASAMAAFAELLPRPPLTRDQVKLLQHDNVVSPNALTLRDLGIMPEAAEMIVPQYLRRFARPARQAMQT